MGLFGGGSSSTSGVTSSIDFSPIIQFGEDQSSSFDKKLDQTQDISPKFDDSTGISASVGVAGGAGGPASTARQQQEEYSQPTQTAPLQTMPFKTVGSSMGLMGLGALFIGGAFLLNNKKKA